METRPRAVGEYLRQLERSLGDLPADRRSEIVTEIEEHIGALLAERGPSPSDADVRNVLERVGRPDDIASEARDEVGAAPVRRRWTDIAAVVALPFPFVGWVVGAVFLWMSDVWSTRDKIIGTAAGPGLLVLGGLVTVAAWGGGATPFEPVGATPVETSGGGPELAGDGGGDGGGLGPTELLVVALVFLVPVAASIYLARKLRTPTESDGRPPGTGGSRSGDVSALALLLLPFFLIVLDAYPSRAFLAIVWSAGVVLLWLSNAWSAREKALATLLAPGGGTLSLVLIDASDYAALGFVAVAIFAIAALVPPIYLGRRLRDPRARDLAAAR